MLKTSYILIISIILLFVSSYFVLTSIMQDNNIENIFIEDADCNCSGPKAFKGNEEKDQVGISPKSFRILEPFKQKNKINVINPMNGINTINNHHPDRFMSWSLLTQRAKEGTKKRK